MPVNSVVKCNSVKESICEEDLPVKIAYQVSHLSFSTCFFLIHAVTNT